ncbi:hypothetical protein [Bradyrhizobium iriomotense]|uniref:hypothetical protein n=1 Tax=Bradyrhizobium iriomotense TaxID=441950 RepID=UPI001B8A3F2C|nr:hypothetical protein [Bradyrhizobium iriomotense]MBR0783029.1 hypothetical protein [Bradyrhizobium iriomotense]
MTERFGQSKLRLRAKEKRCDRHNELPSQPASVIPPDDPTREVRIAMPDAPNVRHFSVPFGDTYTVRVTGQESGGRYCLIDPGRARRVRMIAV